jgi:hypothetical protein
MRAGLGLSALLTLSFLALAGGTGRAATYSITVSPKPPTGPGIGKIVMATSGSASVTVAPSGAMTITGGSAVFLAPGGAVSTSGTASPGSPQMTITCVTSGGGPSKCAGRTINATIQAAGGGTGPAATVTSFSVAAVSCAGCSFGSTSGTAILTLPIVATGDFTAIFNVGMTVTFNPASVSGGASAPFSVSAQ